VRDPLDLGLEGLFDDARTATGLDDFGDDSFREGLGVLLDTYGRNDLRPGGRKRTRARLLQLLANRLKLERAWKRRPEILEREIRSPLYLTGLPRTGTSTLFNLLGCDPASRPLLLWEGVCPDPLEDHDPSQPDPRMQMIQAGLDADRARNPDFDKIHFARADGPEECVLLLAHTFRDVQLGVEPLMQPYGAWFERQDLRAPYSYYRGLLKTLDWQRSGERWLLKSPAHLWAIDVILELFPDACILHTHRDPVEVIASYCSMIVALMSIRASVDPLAIGPAVLEYLARSLERGLAARDRCDPRRFLDVDYRAFTADPVAEIGRVYDYYGLELPSAAERAMRRFLDENPQHKHGAHRYALEEFGLSAPAVRERLQFYVDRFDLGGRSPRAASVRR
jgi:hypothetical protein